jgi:putative FmdB family regulatory protein
MPRYSYQCECGVRFETTVSFSKRNDAAQCPSCESVAERAMPDTVSGVFAKDVTGPGPQNTGIHSLDAHIDRVIGKSAEQGWSTQQRRSADKREFIRDNPEVLKEGMTRNPDGSWGKLPKERLSLRERAFGSR